MIQESDLTAEFGDSSYPELPTEPGRYALRGLWCVLEWRDEAIFRTRFIRNLWVPLGDNTTLTKYEGETFLVQSPSTKDATRFLEAGQPVFITVR